MFYMLYAYHLFYISKPSEQSPDEDIFIHDGAVSDGGLLMLALAGEFMAFNNNLPSTWSSTAGEWL